MNKYPSPSTGKPVRFDQYLAEILVERQAREKLVTLPLRYWSNPKYLTWKKAFLSQQRGILALLKIYNEEAILRACRHNTWLYSVHFHKFSELVQEEQRKFDIEKQIEKPDIKIIKDTTSISKPFGKASKISKLKD